MYFTEIHWAIIGIFSFLSLFILIFSYIKLDMKNFITVSLITVALSLFATISLIFGVDKAIKEAKILQISSKKLYRTENFLIQGRLKNTGNWKIGEAILEVTIYDRSVSRIEQSMFTPMAWLTDLFIDKDEAEISTTQEVIIARNLDAGQITPFTVTVKYPTNMKNPDLRFKLKQH